MNERPSNQEYRHNKGNHRSEGCPQDEVRRVSGRSTLAEVSFGAFFAAEDTFDGVVLDTIVVVGVAEPPAELLVGLELRNFVF